MEERQRIIDEIKSATGLSGRAREFPTDTEKARKAVSRAIREAIEKIRKDHPTLADHLDESIHTGGSCYYLSDGIEWEV
jgi:hypothetical protein